MSPPVLIADRFTLRGFEAGDIDRLAEILADPQVMRYMPGHEPLPREKAKRSLDGIIDHWRRQGYGRWAVVYNEGRRLIGWCGLTFIPELEETEVAYLVDKDYWNRGIATEASMMSVRFGFEEVGLERVIALAFPENGASRRVMEKIGMTYKGRVNVWNLDLVAYSIEKKDFRGA